MRIANNGRDTAQKNETLSGRQLLVRAQYPHRDSR